MDVNVVAIAIFILFSLATPVLLVLVSKALRKGTKRNAVKDLPYESAEESSGVRMAVMHEYLQYFPMFIAFEILVGVVLVWAPIARAVQFIPSVAVLSLLFVGLVFEAFIAYIAKAVEQDHD